MVFAHFMEGRELMEGGERMVHEATKLVYAEGKPVWLTADGSFIPAMFRKDGSLVNGALYIRDRSRGGAVRRISH